MQSCGFKSHLPHTTLDRWFCHLSFFVYMPETRIKMKQGVVKQGTVLRFISMKRRTVPCFAAHLTGTENRPLFHPNECFPFMIVRSHRYSADMTRHMTAITANQKMMVPV